MSSSTFSTELRPDRGFRAVVLVSGAGFAIAGVFLILSMPLGSIASLVAGGSWLTFCGREWLCVRRGFSRCRRLRFTADGKVMRLDPDGEWQPARLMPGSMLLRHAGWLVLEVAKGRRAVEPVRGHCRESNDWRRLQVIWRHVGATP